MSPFEEDLSCLLDFFALGSRQRSAKDDFLNIFNKHIPSTKIRMIDNPPHLNRDFVVFLEITSKIRHWDFAEVH